MPTVSVKWQKELYPNVEIDTSQSPYVFKCQLYDLTGVPPERQKIMVKGGLLKDDADWSKLGVKEGQKLMMMGTADEIVKAPEKGPIFAEDMPEEELVIHVGHSAGLFNLGNTCYMNSTVQCLHSVPELKSALIKYPRPVRSNEVDQTSHLLTVATRDLFNDLDKNVKPVAPMRFLTELRKKYPQFAQLHNGVYMQQDAEECWTQLIYTLSQSLKSPSSSEDPDAVKRLFGIDLVSRYFLHSACCFLSFSHVVSFVLFLLGNLIRNHIHNSISSVEFQLRFYIMETQINGVVELVCGLKSELEKASPSLGRSSLYLKDSRINDLPRYLTIQFVRFFWKRESNQKAKILRKVDYPLELDVYDFCSDDLRKRLEVPRRILRDEEGKKLGLKTSDKNSGSTDNDVKMAEAEASSNRSGNSSKSESVEDAPEKEKALTGIYDLVAVLTHKGRSADSGHYVAWVKQENGKWIQFDDDNPIPQREDDITRLSGGGDWHMAYICMYKARVVPM
ncbi:ubiquitin carboxyl-terminal hydrolase 6-like [Olea europaea var. sylvestris]|uniref:ubiquitin carboxyl-terminal hydrolase 6-like n=1 Tax=Olea europaea var. sylvestris TaxID=158386 RepID=UPI000C1D22D4|nr:ubiquitin carboxyl-terminal hydrolase 6-like [Olea europaea var. sylvestris]